MNTKTNIQPFVQDSSLLEVAIVGLGPTGLTLAHLLGKRGVKVTVLEREPVFYGNARAVYTDDECLRVFQEAGVAEALHADMLFDMPVQLVDANGIPHLQYLPKQRINGWPVVNFFYQPYLETKLTELLNAHSNITVLRGREVVDIQQDATGVTLTHAASTGTGYGRTANSEVDSNDTQTLRAKYVVACDGGRSAVRTKLDIKMTGKSFPEPWLVVDLRLKEGQDDLRHLPYFNFYCDPDLPTVSCPQPDGFHRFEFMLKPGQTKEYMEDPATVRSLVSRHVDPDKFDVMRKLVYTFNALVAERWREGRILLAGDAAHMTPQFMGQGMSSGVRDAYNLAWKLQMVLAGNASDRLLDSYEQERRYHAKAMIDSSVRLKNVVSVSSPLAASIRNLIMKGACAVPPVHHELRESGMKPKPRYKKDSYFGLPRKHLWSLEGSLAPQPTVCDLEGRHAQFDDLIGNGFAVIGLGVDPRDELSAASLALLRSLNTRFITLYSHGKRPQGHSGVAHTSPVGLIELEDLNNQFESWLGTGSSGKNTVVVLRPDKYVFAIEKNTQLENAVRLLEQKLGTATSTSFVFAHA